jgi:xanthine dehydrogenase/oxidase
MEIRTAQGLLERKDPEEHLIDSSFPPEYEGICQEAKKIAESNGTQCGYCTPGWVCTAYDLSRSSVDVEDLFLELDSNICRCTGYKPIVKAVQEILEAKQNSVSFVQK